MRYNLAAEHFLFSPKRKCCKPCLLQMHLLENHIFNRKGKLLVFLSVIILSGIPWWFISYETYLSDPLFNRVSVLICITCFCAMAWFTRQKKRELLMIVLTAHQFAFLIKVYIDHLAGAVNHNSFAAEMLIFLLIDLLAMVVASIIISGIKR
ncbi:MAG: hypothetical protein J0I09_06760 [Sphingobacteriia bacterium]|nr:hypothetical protein [Sphingobacteriia bacterium]